MNKERRASLDKIHSALEQLREDLDNIGSEEREYYDNMPESFQTGEKGDLASAAADALENAVASLEDAIVSVEEAKA